MIETKRLIISPWQRSDLADLKMFLQDETVMYAYEHAFSDEEVAAWLDWNLISYQENDYGLWKLTKKSNGEVIGECGITDQIVGKKTYQEIGYHLGQKYWHQGYAIEAAQAVKGYGFSKWQFPELISTVRDTNISSMNVAIRNGMLVKKRFIKEYRGITMPHYLFAVKNPGGKANETTLSMG